MRQPDEVNSDVNEALKPLSEQAVQVLVANHRRFQDFLSKRLSSKSEAEDILQQSLKKAIEKPTASAAEGSVLAWFFEILRNTLTDHYRSQASGLRKMDDLKSFIAVHGQDRIPPADDLKAGVCQCLKGLLPALKPEYADLLQRIDLGSDTPEAVASDLGISRNNLDVRLHRARKALKTSLERACGSCTAHGCLSCSCG